MWLQCGLTFEHLLSASIHLNCVHLGADNKIPGQMFLSQVMAELLQKGLGPGKIQESTILDL